jgi:IclR family acetate operon transcriptional repressor
MGQERLLHVFEAVAAAQPASLADVAVRAAMPSSTAHRSLGVLADAGWVRPVGPGRPRWVVTERLRTMLSGPSVALVALARPLLAGLAGETGETAVLWLADGSTVVAATAAAPAAALRVVVAEGERLPCHTCAPGKVVLAARRDTDVRLAAVRGLEPATPRTVGDVEQLLVELRRVRRDGIAVARDEEADGVASVAAPAGTGAEAAIGIVGPTDRVDGRLAELVDVVRRTAARLPVDG